MLLSTYVVERVTGLPFWEALGALALAHLAMKRIAQSLPRKP